MTPGRAVSPFIRWLRRWPELPVINRFRGMSRKDLKFLRTILGDVRRVIAPPPNVPDPRTWRSDRVTAAWIGHSTVLINFYGITILTDPVLSSRAGINLGLFVLGPKRFVAPALRFKDLPPIDVVLISHAHMDHFDLPTLRRFGKQTIAVTAHATGDLLRRTRLRHRLRELAWGDSTRLDLNRTDLSATGSLEIEAFEVNHWGARMRTDDYRGYNGYILRRGGRALIFGGDTANTQLFRNIRGRGASEHDGRFDLAFLPIGAYNPWIKSHCTPEQAVTMANDAGAGFIAPLHHQTFRLSQEPLEEPIQRFERKLAGTPERVAWREIGETFELPFA